MRTGFEFSPTGRGLLYGGAFVVIVAGLRAASSIIVPLLLATFFTIICAPVLKVLQRKLPFPLALTLVLLMLVGVFMAVPVMIGGSLQQLLRALPALQQQLRGLEATLVSQLQQWDLGISGDDVLLALDPDSATAWLGGFLNGLLRTFSDGVVVLIMTAFMLTETSWFSLKLALIDRASGDGAKRINQIMDNVRRYLGIKTIISMATGFSVWLGLVIMGIDYAIVWGFLAFLLNYIPTIGSVIAGIPTVLLALVQHGFGMALGVAILYLVANQVFGSVIEPRWQGQGLGLSPLIVFISLVFWGWILGPVGMLLSAPLTMALKISLEEFSETHWIAIMLGGKPPTRKGGAPAASS
jgi:predicted PurR-regulated permease PerM